MNYVLDASVALKCVLPEPLAAEVRLLRGSPSRKRKRRGQRHGAVALPPSLTLPAQTKTPSLTLPARTPRSRLLRVC